MKRLRRFLFAALLSLAGAAPAAPDQSMAGWSASALATAKARIEALGQDLAQAPAQTVKGIASTRAALMSGPGVRGFTYLMILVFTGVAVEWLYWTYAYSPLRAVRAARPSAPLQALRLGMRRLFLAGAGLLLFAAATIGASAALAWPAGVHEMVIAATLLLLTLRLSWILAGVVLAPGRPELRLVPVEPERARWLATTLVAALVLLALGHFLPAIIARAAGASHSAGALRFLAYTAAAVILFVAAFAFFGRRDQGARAPLFPRSFPLALMVAATWIVWLMNPAMAAPVAIVAVVIALQIGLRDMVYFYWRGEDNPEGGEGALPAIVLSLSRFVVVLAGIGAAALALDTPLGSLAETVSPWVRIGLRLLGVAVLALLAHGVWIAVRSVVDQRLSRIAPADPHQPPDASSRLLTLLPLMRVTTAVILFVMLVLSSLWALGIEITPLLAGAGVVGLAVGFGAQALVRDIIAGIFYLADDAFRVGEYVESGTSIKGTVERITLRSVALRHHNGPLHFVPYGVLGAVRNASRDWVIDKFNIPLPIDADSEKIRKMIKKIGEDMKEDPAIGPLMLEPLKGKLYRIDPGVKIFRCKFRSPPGKQFDIRAAAIKRIEAGLKKLGVSFADGKQIAIMQGAPGTPAEA
ncbi:MAG: mechanosensitive ion channel family protein [Betaproteobacteria bacterium]